MSRVPSARSLPPGSARMLARLGWFAAAVLVALGSSGLVAALDHRPGSAARAELTWAADEVARGHLEAIVRDLEPVAMGFDQLGGLGRGALSALVATDPEALEGAISLGGTLVGTIGLELAGLQERVAGIPGIGPGAEGRLSPAVLARVAMVVEALHATSGTAQAWATLASGATVAARLTRRLIGHDQSSGQIGRASCRERVYVLV